MNDGGWFGFFRFSHGSNLFTFPTQKRDHFSRLWLTMEIETVSSLISDLLKGKDDDCHPRHEEHLVQLQLTLLFVSLVGGQAHNPPIELRQLSLQFV